MSGLETVVATAVGAIAGEYGKRGINREKLKHIVEDVDSMVGMLEEKRKVFDNEIKRTNLSKPSDELKSWNEALIELQSDVKKLKDEYKDRVKFLRPFWRPIYKIEMQHMSSRAKALLDRGDFTVSHNRLFALLSEPVEKLHNVPDIKGFSSLQTPLEEALRSLRRNRENKVIIICGTMGVGKTSVLKNLNNHEKVANLFDAVIFLKASAGKNEETLRREIAQRLHLGDQGNTAGSISNVLEKCKCLLLLDDVTKNLDLSQIGIPDNNPGSKVVLTSRSPYVCRSSNVKVIKVKPLTRDEALKMFKEMVSNVINLPGIRSLADDVVDKCNGLPFLIKAVASSLKWKPHASLWRDAMNDLRCLDTKWGVEGVQEVYDFLSSCYDTMKTDEMKKNCFFYVALFPAGDRVCANHLLESWTEEGFFNGLHRGAANYQAKLDRGYAILDELIKVSLLDKDDEDKKIKGVYMHNIIQDFALYELSRCPDVKFLVEKGESSLDLENLAYARISMIGTERECLPEIPDCSMLLTLLLQRSPTFKTIPQSLFKHAKSIQLLDLHQTSVQSLSPSISKMTAMKALYLNACSSLQELPAEIARLTSLEVLDIRGTGIAFIPLPIAELVGLKILRMSYNYKHDGVIDNQENRVISRLDRLEELVIEVFSTRDWCNEVADVTQQLFGLTNLCKLRFCFPATDSLQTHRLSTFRLFVGCPFKRSPKILQYMDFTVDRYLRYCRGELKDREQIRGVISQSQALELIDHKDITRLSDLEGEGDFDELHGLLINKCHKLVSIVDDTSRQIGKNLPIPQQLYLNDLSCLKSVFEGNKQLGRLDRLKVLELKNCPLLTKVFSEEMIKQLTGLRELKIEDCAILEDLNMEPRDGGLSSLKILRLHNLQSLKTISRDQSLAWPALEVLDIRKCPQLNNLTFNKDNAPQLSLIEGEKTWWDTSLDAEVKKTLLRMCSLKLS